MGSFSTPTMGGNGQQPMGGPPGQSPMDTLMGPGGITQTPQQLELQAQAGALDQLRQVEMAFQSLSQIVQQMAAAYPGGAEPARQVMASLDQGKQALLGMLVPMMSGTPDGQPPGPAYMGG